MIRSITEKKSKQGRAAGDGDRRRGRGRGRGRGRSRIPNPIPNPDLPPPPPPPRDEMMMGRRSGEGGRNRQGLGWAACCLGFLLKLLAFLQAFAAVSAILYAAWILSRWARHQDLHLQDLLPGLWFPSLVMAAGLFYCLLLLAGYLAAEINTGCCLCFVLLSSRLVSSPGQRVLPDSSSSSRAA
jgi:hypothetical protein